MDKNRKDLRRLVSSFIDVKLDTRRRAQFGGDFGGVSHAVILTPVPEPSSVALAGLALAGLSAFAVRKRFKPAT